MSKTEEEIREQKKQWRQSCRRRIVMHALQIQRLKGSGCSLGDDGSVYIHCHSDVPNQIRGHEVLLEAEARTLLMLLGDGGENDE